MWTELTKQNQINKKQFQHTVFNELTGIYLPNRQGVPQGHFESRYSWFQYKAFLLLD